MRDGRIDRKGYTRRRTQNPIHINKLSLFIPF